MICVSHRFKWILINLTFQVALSSSLEENHSQLIDTYEYLKGENDTTKLINQYLCMFNRRKRFHSQLINQYL